MNKTKLELIRINEDVIATSVLKKGTFSGYCVKFIDDGDISNVLDSDDHVYNYYLGAKSSQNKVGAGSAIHKSYFDNAGTTFEFGKYYATYSDGNKTYYYTCDEAHTHTGG